MRFLTTSCRNASLRSSLDPASAVRGTASTVGTPLIIVPSRCACADACRVRPVGNGGRLIESRHCAGGGPTRYRPPPHPRADYNSLLAAKRLFHGQFVG